VNLRVIVVRLSWFN